jgi:excinuclease UvrABC ATPase subunit
MRKAGSDSIRVVGARENNLKDVSLSIPKDRITVFVGVSGSGKSSIVFDTVAVEAQRQLNATFPWFIRNQLPKYDTVLADKDEAGGSSPPRPTKRPLTSGDAGRSSRGYQPARMHPVQG